MDLLTAKLLVSYHDQFIFKKESKLSDIFTGFLF